MILQADGLRTPTLLAFDAANLAVALSASSEQMDCAWRTLAARAAGTEGFAGTSAEDGWVVQGLGVAASDGCWPELPRWQPAPDGLTCLPCDACHVLQPCWP